MHSEVLEGVGHSAGKGGGGRATAEGPVRRIGEGIPRSKDPSQYCISCGTVTRQDRKRQEEEQERRSKAEIEDARRRLDSMNAESEATRSGSGAAAEL